jgi:DNA-binding response OmpR family regulator
MPASSKKIVFAEDNISVVKIVLHTLSSEGYEIIHFPTGDGVVDAVVEHKPDLLILDLVMPVKDGLTVLKEMKENPATSSVPILLLTATKDETTVIKILELGVTDYITKPFSFNIFLARVKKIIEKTKS